MSAPAFPPRPAELRAVFTGRLTWATARDWRECLIALAARRPRLLTLDLSNVTFVDPTLVVTVRALEKRLAPSGGAIALLAPGHLLATLRLMGIGHLLAGSEFNDGGQVTTVAKRG